MLYSKTNAFPLLHKTPQSFFKIYNEKLSTHVTELQIFIRDIFFCYYCSNVTNIIYVKIPGTDCIWFVNQFNIQHIWNGNSMKDGQMLAMSWQLQSPRAGLWKEGRWLSPPWANLVFVQLGRYEENDRQSRKDVVTMVVIKNFLKRQWS